MRSVAASTTLQCVVLKTPPAGRSSAVPAMSVAASPDFAGNFCKPFEDFEDFPHRNKPDTRQAESVKLRRRFNRPACATGKSETRVSIYMFVTLLQKQN